MSSKFNRNQAKRLAIHRPKRKVFPFLNDCGEFKKISDYFGENVYLIKDAPDITEEVKKEILEVTKTSKFLKKEHAEIVANSVTKWAVDKGATHFCHWFQPLTGSTAEKHDSFLEIKNGRPIEYLGGTSLMQGEPDASSFPNGGSRSTFEARGYTCWDLTSPMFLMEGTNGFTLCIPTAFVSYTSEALDIKTPLLRSVTALNDHASKFLNLLGSTKFSKVNATAGAEQEYFLIDKSFYYQRPDLVMTGRTLFGSLSTKNQQLDDHYFGTISGRVLGFMQELDYELHRLGITSKTRHNEVAPGQYELAPIFTDANISADNNQVIMAMIKNTAEKHDFVALLHEKPFANINGSGKHVNWSLATDNGDNLLSPGSQPHENKRFLAVIAIICEAVFRHANLLRASIATQGNDHRLGANEAPPSIISVFLGDTLDRIFESIREGNDFSPNEQNPVDLGATQLAQLLKDNTDRNRTSPFAFTGNKFEFRAVGSSQPIGLPLCILNTAVANIFKEANIILEEKINSGASVDEALDFLTKKYAIHSEKVIFNGDGYSQEWVEEAAKRGLPNLRNTPEALAILCSEEEMKPLVDLHVFSSDEIKMRYHVLLERYNMLREIEFSTLGSLVRHNVIPSGLQYKKDLGSIIKTQKDIGLESSVEVEIYKKINFTMESIYSTASQLEQSLDQLVEDHVKRATVIADELFPLSEKLGQLCNNLEEIVPDDFWTLPKYYDMLFLK